MAEIYTDDTNAPPHPMDEVTTIGRDAANDLHIDDRKVSRRHAVIRRLESGDYEIEDLGSSQGTVVDGRPVITRAQLKHGSEIRIAGRRLRFVARPGEPLPPVAPPPAAPTPGEGTDLGTLGPVTAAADDGETTKHPSGVLVSDVDAHVRERVAAGSDPYLAPVEAPADEALLRAEYTRLRAVYELTRSLVGQHDVHALLTRTLKVLLDHIDAEHGAVLLIDPATRDMQPAVAVARDNAAKEVLVSSTIVNEVIDKREAILSADAGLDQRFGGAGSVAQGGIRSVICAPMLHSNVVIGVIHLHARGKVDAFDQRDLELVSTLAGQAAVVVHGASVESQLRRAHAEERLYLKALLQHLPVGLVVLDEALRPALSNDTGRKMLEAWTAEATGGGVPTVADVLQEEGEDGRELRLQGPPARTLMVTVAALARSEQDPPEHVLALRDVTAIRDREAKVEMQQRLALVGRLVGGVAHDFNNMLAVVLGYAGLASNKLEPDHPVRAQLNEIHSAGERAATLVKQLLHVGRPGRQRPEVLDLDTMVAGMHGLLGRTIGEHIRLEHERTEGLRPVEADPSRLEQVLLNLVVNARDAIEGAGTITIATANVDGEAEGAPDDGRWTRLQVSDSGMGMPAEVAARIFEPFFTTKRKGKGTGLGLATVEEIVGEAGGFISVQSEAGQGTTFTIHLPSSAGTPSAVPDTRRIPVPAGDGQTVLLVEDEAALRRLTRDVLERAGYRVVEARSGAEALRLADSIGEFDLVLSDIVMPGLSGPQLGRALHAGGHIQPVVYMTGYTDDVLEEQGEGQMLGPVLRKPISEDRLRRTLKVALEFASERRSRRPDR